MNKEVKEELKEFIFQAIQAGKSESSNLASDIARKIREGNSDTVKRLDNLTNLVKTHIEHDKEWKETYTPYIKGLASISDGGKTIGKIIVFMASVGGEILAIKKWFL